MFFWIEFHIREHVERLRAEAERWRLMRKALQPSPRPALPDEATAIRRVARRPEMQRHQAA